MSTLASRFHTVRYDLRFFGRSESPGVEFASVDDLVGVLDALGIEQAALVGLSVGGIEKIFGFRAQGASWGLVAADRAINPNPVLDDLEQALGRLRPGGDLPGSQAAGPGGGRSLNIRGRVTTVLATTHPDFY